MSSRIGDTLLDAKAVAEALAIHRVTLWNWVAAGKFPKPDIREGRKYRRWRSSTVQKWRDAR